MFCKVKPIEKFFLVNKNEINGKLNTQLKDTNPFLGTVKSKEFSKD